MLRCLELCSSLSSPPLLHALEPLRPPFVPSSVPPFRCLSSRVTNTEAAILIKKAKENPLVTQSLEEQVKEKPFAPVWVYHREEEEGGRRKEEREDYNWKMHESTPDLSVPTHTYIHTVQTHTLHLFYRLPLPFTLIITLVSH